MAEELPPSNLGGNPPDQNNENDEWRKLLVALLFLLFSFGCIFCSSQAALWVINRDWIEASMRSSLSADYDAPDPLIALAPLDEEIALEAAEDEARLAENLPPLSQGIAVAILPRPIPTPTPVPTIRPLPTVTPTLTPTPSPTLTPVPASDSTPLPAPSPTAPPPAAPSPTEPPPTEPPPTEPPPTEPPPTAPPPTAPPPTEPPPTSPPPTSPPPTPVLPVLSISDAIVSEGDLGAGPAVFTVTLSAASSKAVSVEYATEDGTATAPADYVAVPTTTLNFPSGVLTRLITITVQGDILLENDNTFFVNLANPTNANISDGRGRGTILDDDLPTADFETDSYLVGEANGQAVITVTLSAAWSMTATVEYATNPGGSTAVIGSDYLPASGTLTFPPGITSRTFEVKIIDDAGGPGPDEAITETVELVLNNPVNATLGTVNNPAALSIIDDDSGGRCRDISTVVVNVGPPDCMWTFLENRQVDIDLIAAGASPIDVDLTDPDYDLVYYERMSGSTDGFVDLDQVSVSVSNNGIDWYEVFNWGDGILDANTSIGQAGYGGPGNEENNAPIPMTVPPLYQSSSGGPVTGVAIDIDIPLSDATLVPPPTAGLYQYVRITGASSSEIDSIEVLP